jgi:hypothetical protein
VIFLTSSAESGYKQIWKQMEGKTMSEQGRELTYDEKKAAEAAFNGKPFNPAWSAAAATVYTGITEAMGKRDSGAGQQPAPKSPEPG